MSDPLPPPAPGSSLHYATVFLAPPPRAALTALAALALEIERIPVAVSDPGVAAAKLAWWRTEVQCLSAEAAPPPKHPITRALAQARADHPALDPLALLVLMDGAEADLRQTRFLDAAALTRHYADRDTALVKAAAQVLGVDTGAALAPLARCLRRVGLLADIGAALRRGALWLPVEDLRRHEVKVADLSASRYPAGWGALMSEQAAIARADWNTAIAALPPGARSAARPLLILGEIALRLLREIEREDFRVLHQRVSLTAFTRFRVAARTQVLGPRPA